VDIPRLKAIGIGGIFLPGTPMQEIVRFIEEHTRKQLAKSEE
jgi:methylmalonyl-CoA mutase cobalamin-binding subunit